MRNVAAMVSSSLVWRPLQSPNCVFVNYSTLILGSVVSFAAGFAAARIWGERTSAGLTTASLAAAAEQALRERLSTLSSLSTHLQQRSEAEKCQLARVLHDELGGLLVATKMDMVWLKRRLDGTDVDVRAHWERVLQSLEQALASKSRIIEGLRPTLLDNLGLVPALRWLLEESCRATGVHFEHCFPPEPQPILGQQSIAIFRVAQEALSNVLRHAQATLVIFEMAHEENFLVLRIRDDGVGISRERVTSQDSHGLSAMRSWMLALNGQLSIEPNAAGQGTSVLARVPWSSIRAKEPSADNYRQAERL
jgi:protein-histidine pros-kinase